MTRIRWPDGLEPASSALHVRNELETDVEPEKIWPWLVRATRWHELYANCRGLVIHDPRAISDLHVGTRFSWRTFGVPVTTVVEELVVGERLAWRGEGLGARGYHAWALERRGPVTLFVTEECQRGVLPRLLRGLLRPGLVYYHQRWLEGLVRAARLGHPDHVKEIAL